MRDPAEAVGRHVADSLSAIELPYVAAARRIADLGSGAGWPGLALAAALPDAHVWLVESAIRHCRYLERAVELSGLTNVTVVHARIEEWQRAARCRHRSCAGRACPCSSSTPRRCWSRGGHFVAWKGAASPEETSAGAVAAGIVGLEPVEVIPVVPYEGARDHSLHVFRKTGETPERFPRRAGHGHQAPARLTRMRRMLRAFHRFT